jgi:hypothetical protein
MFEKEKMADIKDIEYDCKYFMLFTSEKIIAVVAPQTKISAGNIRLARRR